MQYLSLLVPGQRRQERGSAVGTGGRVGGQVGGQVGWQVGGQVVMGWSGGGSPMHEDPDR
jgi:hypothetical protein